jgi:autotransporter-associated beta strand protein
VTAATLLSNGDFSGSLTSWTADGTVFNTGDQAVFSDSVATPTALFQTVAVGAEFAGFEISFDVLNGLSPTVTEGYVLDSFYASVYFNQSPAGPALDLFSVDADGFFGIAEGATFGVSAKGANWTRYTLRASTSGLFEGEGFLTVAFEFFNLNGVGSDSTAAVDNVSLTVLSAPLRWLDQVGTGLWDLGASANWQLLSGGPDRVFMEGAPVVFDGDGGVVSVEAAGVLPGGVTVSAGGYTFAGGPIGGAAALTKSGAGLLVIESAHTYTGGTVVTGDGTGASGLDCFCTGGVLETLFCVPAGGASDAGSALWVMNATGSGTGSGAVQVGAGGMLGGVGSIAGAVTVEGGAGGRARLVPGGIGAPLGLEILRLEAGLTMGEESEVVFRLGQDGLTALEVAGGVQIDAGARVRVVLEGTFVPQPGALFRVIVLTNGGVTLTDPNSLALPAGIDWDSSDFAAQGILRVRGTASALQFTRHPVAQTVRPGESVSFSVAATGPGPLMYRWQKDGVEIPGENTSSLVLTGIEAGDEGDYEAVVFNGLASVVSEGAALQVRDVPKITAQSPGVVATAGDDVTFSVTVTGPGTLAFVWQKDGVDLPGGPDAESLTVSAVSLEDAGRYRVMVSNAFGSVTSAEMPLAFAAAGTVATDKPVIPVVGIMPAGQVGAPYSFFIPVQADDLNGQRQRQPTRFTASGLPAGLVCNPTTGEVSGVPRIAKVAPFKVTLVASNKKGKATVKTTLLVAPLPAGIAGTFTGPVGRHALINGGLGGSLVVKVAASGAVSGSHDEGGRRRPFRGAVVLNPASPQVVMVGVTVARGRGVTPHQLAFALDSRTGRLINGSLTDGPNSVPVAGWRNPWGKLNLAKAIEGYYTASMGWKEPGDVANDTLPQGLGFVSVTVNAKTGGARLSGRLMDGSAITGSTFAGPNGQVLVFRKLYAVKVRGSLLGMLVLTPKAANADNVLEGCVSWNRPENLATSNRLYRPGFTPHVMDILGGRYTAPAKDTRILGLTDTNNRAVLTLARAGLEAALPEQEDTSFVLSKANKATFVKEINKRLITFSVVAKTGLFKGSLTLKQNNPALLPDKETPVKRRITYQGLLIGREREGVGYALVPQLPAEATQTTRNTPILSAGVLLEPVPVPVVVP